MNREQVNTVQSAAELTAINFSFCQSEAAAVKYSRSDQWWPWEQWRETKPGCKQRERWRGAFRASRNEKGSRV